MGTTDGFKGFKKLHHFPNVAMAVSKTGKLEVGKVYEAPAGWHWGSKVEVAAIMGGGMEARQPGKRYYRNQGGWDRCIWGGVKRTRFVFSDSLEVGGCLYPGHHEGQIDESLTADGLAIVLPSTFAGIVCVAN